MSHLPNHKATVDADGNIALPGSGFDAAAQSTVRIEEVTETMMEEGAWHHVEQAAEPVYFDAPWETTVEDTVEEVRETVTTSVEGHTTHLWQSFRADIKRVTDHAVHEGVKQYAESIKDGERIGAESARTVASVVTRTWSFLKQPVWVPNKKKEPVQRSRGTLFMVDSLRFGGTFASLFGLLFITLNYQSFWAIAQSYVDPLAEATGIKDDGGLDRGVAEKLKRIPELATAGGSDAGLIAYLPLVGPPDDRLIIPALDINVPIVVPSTEPLIKEDWKALEEEIQTSLQDGVVHYPGTAKPGQAGNFFVTGHSSYFPWAPGAYKSVFARLHELKVGDEYWVFYGGDRHRYVITGEKEIKPSDVSVLEQPVDKRISTLMTCTPVGTTLRRLVLTAEEVDPVSGIALEVGERGKDQLPQLKMDTLSI